MIPHVEWEPQLTPSYVSQLSNHFWGMSSESEKLLNVVLVPFCLNVTDHSLKEHWESEVNKFNVVVCKLYYTVNDHILKYHWELEICFHLFYRE